VSEALLELRNVHFAYEASRPVLRGASLELRPGERVALCGGNGAGKTTLLHVAVGLLVPSAGEVIAFGERRRREREFVGVRARVGLLFQDPDDQLFCPSVAEDVAFGPLNLGRSPAQAREIAAQTLARLGIAELAPRSSGELSGGEKRLATLATVLAMEPEVLLLDEPTQGLDDAAQERLAGLLERLPQAMCLVSHDRPFRARLSTRSLALVQGRVEADAR
jgi:cobalt/nickel transport system ATP-binding protein